MALQAIQGTEASWTPVLLSMNGQKFATILPGTNIPYGYEKVDFNTWKQYAQKKGVDGTGQKYIAGQTMGTDYGDISAYEKMMNDPTLSQVLQQWEQGNMNTPSGQVQAKDTTSGQTVWTTQNAVQEQAQRDADIASGKLVQIAPGQYAPAGSAATTNPLGSTNSLQALQNQLATGKDILGNPLNQNQIDNIKQQINQLNVAPGPASSGGSNNGSQQVTPGNGQSGSVAGNTNTGSAPKNNNNQSALDIINNSDLDPGQKMLFQQIVQNWDPNSEVNVPNILNKFNEIKTSTIDPFFREQSNIFIDQIKNTFNDIQGARNLQLEAEKTNASQNIENAQNSLEARGMTFSGEGVRQLGAQSAYAQTQQNSAIPTQEALPGGGFAEGLVNQQNRLMSTSSQAQYMKNLRDLSRQAETTLGSAASSNLVPGVQQMGNITQTAALPNQKSQAEGSTLSNLYNQSLQNIEQNKPIKPFNQ